MKDEMLDEYPNSEWQYQCTSCGDQISEDHDYCSPCDQRGGEWKLVDADGEEIDTNTYGTQVFPELIVALDRYLDQLEDVLNEPEMQTKIDKHGNEACRRVRGGTRVAMESLKDALRRAKL